MVIKIDSSGAGPRVGITLHMSQLSLDNKKQIADMNQGIFSYIIITNRVQFLCYLSEIIESYISRAKYNMSKQLQNPLKTL